MSFGAAIGVLLVVCCLVPGTFSTFHSWSLEIPENCPHQNNETHVCSAIVSSRKCLYFNWLCCDKDESATDETEEISGRDYGDDDDDDDSSESCSNGICGLTIRSCIKYRCAERCCDGYARDYAGRCRDATDGLECQNGGSLLYRYGYPYCSCRGGFQGRSCEIPICNCANMGECTVLNGEPHCECMEGYSGQYCEQAHCSPACQNGGSCVSDGYTSACMCPQGFVGESCEGKHLNSALCPAPLYYSTSNDCRLECRSDADCSDSDVCCNEGSSLICRTPEVKTCVHDNKEYAVGEQFKPDACTTCRCYTGGKVECYSIACSWPICSDGQRPVHTQGECCPSCPPEVEQCTHNGNNYSIGERFHPDPCQSCECKSSGEVVCAMMRCAMPTCPDGQSPIHRPGECCMSCPPAQCTHNGVVYADGVSFKDECNTCQCINGKAACTKRKCVSSQCTLSDGTIYESGTSWDDDCNTCQCDTGRVTCTEIRCVTSFPGCSYNGANYNEGETFSMDCNECICTNGQSVCSKEKCGCTLKCKNNGICVKDENGVEMCLCEIPYYGKICENRHDNSARCPKPDDDSTESSDDCKRECETTDNCATGTLCCMEGCSMLCRSPAKVRCQYDGREFEQGHLYFPDPCTTCSCTDSGNMACYTMDCPASNCAEGQTPISLPDQCCSFCPDGTCEHNGITYDDGDYFRDGCNTCQCSKGAIGCTTIACPSTCEHNGVTYKEGESFQDDCNTCRCSNGGVSCTEMACPNPIRMKCPKDIVRLDVPASSSFVRLTAYNMNVSAHGAYANVLKVKFDPPIGKHCECYDSDRAVHWAVATVTNNGNVKQCKIPYVVKDIHPPVFKTCPEDMYVFENEAITFKKPKYSDNVGIGGVRSGMDPVKRTYSKGEYYFKYEIWDYERNYAYCKFKLSVSETDESFENLPQGLKNRSTDGPSTALIAGPIVGLLLIIIIIVLLLLFCRYRRGRTNFEAQNARNGAGEAYDNHIYNVPDDVKSLPPNPPAYQSDTISTNSVYASIAPPVYKEVEELRAPASYYVNPDYESVKGSSKSSAASSVGSI